MIDHEAFDAYYHPKRDLWVTLDGHTKCAICQDVTRLKDMFTLSQPSELEQLHGTWYDTYRQEYLGLVCAHCKNLKTCDNRYSMDCHQFQKKLPYDSLVRSSNTDIDIKRYFGALLDTFVLENRLQTEINYYSGSDSDYSYEHYPCNTHWIKKELSWIMRARHFAFKWKRYVSRQRTQKRCREITRELMEAVWHPQRVERMGWDVEDM
jgi:hypothetical protein